MPGFVWVKTIKGARTAGFFAFQASGGKLYTSEGTHLELPPGSVMMSGEELMTTISKSSPKGMYVCAWKETRDEWSQYLDATSQTIRSSISCRPDYFMLNNAITTITDMAGMSTPRNQSKDVVAERKADARAKKAKIELDFKDKIDKALQLLKPYTVRRRPGRR